MPSNSTLWARLLRSPLSWGLSLYAGLWTLPAMAIPALQYSQDGINFQSIQSLSTALSAKTYYDYRQHTGHPGFGTAMRTDTVSLVWDTTDSALSMIFISGGGIGDKGSGRVSLTGLPTSAQLALSDDTGEFRMGRRGGTLTGRFAYQDATDGLVLTGLEAAPFTAKLKLGGTRGIKTLRIADGNPQAGGQFITLNLRQPLWIRSGVATTNIPPNVGGGTVPEPASLGLVGLLITALVKRPRR